MSKLKTFLGLLLLTLSIATFAAPGNYHGQGMRKAFHIKGHGAKKLFQALSISEFIKERPQATVTIKNMPGLRCKKVIRKNVQQKPRFSCVVKKRTRPVIAKNIYDAIRVEAVVIEEPQNNKVSKVDVKKVCPLRFKKVELTNGKIVYRVNKIKMTRVSGTSAKNIYNALDITPVVEVKNGKEHFVKKVGSLTCKEVKFEDDQLRYNCILRKGKKRPSCTNN